MTVWPSWDRNDPTADLGFVKATRDIAAGEEITLNYGASGGRRERQRVLQARFRFVCTCERCQREEVQRSRLGMRHALR